MAYTDPQFFVPFLFVLAVVFGALNITNVFKSRAVNAIISLVMAFFAASYQPFTTALWGFLPSITWFFIIMFFVSLLVQLSKPKGGKPPDYTFRVIVTGIIFVILFSLQYYLLSLFPAAIPYIGGATNLLYLMGLIFVLVLFYYAYQSGKEGK
jgi:hypothetical protein